MRFLIFLILSLFLSSFLIIGCGGEPTFVDRGNVCLGSTDSYGAGPIEADQEFSVRVSTLGCYSSSCSTMNHSHCEVSLEGGELVIRSEIDVRDTTRRSFSCTDDCHSYGATCAAPGLAEGEYTVRHGEDTFSLQIPAAEPHCTNYF